MSGAVGAVVAVDCFVQVSWVDHSSEDTGAELAFLAGIALVGVVLECVAALGQLEGRLGDNLVEGEGAASEDLACVAVAVGLVLGIGLWTC